jgi:RNA polymerase sigma factor (sigma-70 family)
MDDKELINQCRQGDRVAMEKIYLTYSPRMRALCCRYVRTSFETDEILQDAFLKVFSHIRDYQFLGSFEGWIKKIVVNTAINHYRKNIRFNHVDYNHLSPSKEKAAEIADQLSLEELYRIINKLPEGYRFVFNMFAIDGYSHDEIARMLNISSSTSRSQYTRARKNLMQMINQSNYVGDER